MKLPRLNFGSVSLKRRFALLFIVFVVAILSMMVFTTVQQISTVARIIGNDLSLPVARRAAAMIDGDEFERLIRDRDPSDPYYEVARQKLLKLKTETGCLYLYTMAPLTDTVHMFIVDGSVPPDDPTFVPLGREEDVSDYEASYAKTFETKTPQTGTLDTGTHWGILVSSFVPIFNSKGDMVGVVGCDIDAESIYRAIRAQVLREILMVLVFTILGVVLYLSLVGAVASQNEQLLELNRKAQAAAEAKSNFLTVMSHEIRTPMNAVVGMTELLLRLDLPKEANEHLLSIKQAGANLLSIINDILDFSKIESGRLEIVRSQYMFASIITDVINITRMRMGEKRLRFITRIDGSMPSVFSGDEVRIRQVLLNLLSNAVKYTEKGSITFSAHGEKTAPSACGDDYMLYFDVEDTGIGIREESLDKLFGDFIRLDSKKNRIIEGTGLGLAISRKLCTLMGGDITVRSEYGKGSVFSAAIPQRVVNPQPFASVDAPETKRVLICDRRNAYSNSIKYALSFQKVFYKDVRTREELGEELAKGGYSCVFVGLPEARAVRRLLCERGFDASVVVAITEYGKACPEGCRALYMPANPLMIANILNDSEPGVATLRSKAVSTRFTAPDARVLIVDDIQSNLDVAVGLLAPYKMTVDTARSGAEAIAMAQGGGYDLILMDHMMPGMDGIEAATAIRALDGDYYKNLPIIILTANAISGMREMFLAAGFNDYLAKPIEIPRFDKVMSQWIPEWKKVKSGWGTGSKAAEGAAAGAGGPAGLAIDGVDVPLGVARVGGRVKDYLKVLASFHEEMRERLDGPAGFASFDADASEEGLRDLITGVHGIKGVAGTIGAAGVAAEAAELEALGRGGDAAAVAARLPDFCEKLRALQESVADALAAADPDGAETAPPAPAPAPESPLPLDADACSDVNRGKLERLKKAIEAWDIDETDRLMGELEQSVTDTEAKKTLGLVSDLVLGGRYREAAALMDKGI
ncbi:MAG: response regulator [Acidobacteriota bacterium]|jgi:signal transduction histidine kinase/CheY-like chemotaxis protein|nr:response regulator [Acidobacteriota bacterium]